jgi:ribonuclease G
LWPTRFDARRAELPFTQARGSACARKEIVYVPWFRRRKPEEERPEAASSPAAPPEPLEEAPEPAPDSGPQEAGEPATKPAKRRRGSRGGRGRAKKDVAADRIDAPEEAKAGAAKRRAPKAGEENGPAAKPRQRRERKRRTAAPKRGAAANVEKAILVSVDVGEQRVAVLEDGKPAEVYLERRGRRSIAGNVYKGLVDNVLPGMEASFVDIGLEKNGFLYVDEIVVPELEGKRGTRRIQDLVQRGQEVLVQAVKDPMGTKGARLTTEISLPGRFLVYVPFGEGIGVSRRLEDDERERLKAICRGLELEEGGIIVRTAAEGASEAELEGDLRFLGKLWETIKARAESTKAPALVYQEAELPLRIVRDLFIRDFTRVVVDDERTYRRIVGYLGRTSPELAARVELYAGPEALMERSGVDEAVRSTLNRRVDLPSGGYLIFDYAEAFTVIDVNTGRFVGSRGKGTGARLEDTITKNNLEAVVEVVRQLRLRDIGGIIVIDFIDMANPKNRELVEEALKSELERDRTKTYVVEISPLGLVEMTRQNVTDGPREILTQRCPVCAGDGIVVSPETHAIDVERRIRHLVEPAKAEAFSLELNAHVADLLVGSGGARLIALEEETGKRLALAPSHDLPLDHVAVLAEGPWAKIEQRDLPLSAGQELMVKLEPGDEDDAAAAADGFPIAVAGAAGKVGRRMKIRVVRTTPARAYAVLTSAKRADDPVIAEDLAETAEEKPKSPSRRAKARKPAVVESVDEVETAATGGEAATGTPEGTPAEEPKEPLQKKTRRGSSGGRAKKKAAVAAAADSSEAHAVPEVVDEPEATERVGAEAAGETAGEAEERPAKKKKKKTRRGSRGGRGRKKKAAVEGAETNGAGSTEEAAAAVAAVGVPGGAPQDAPAPDGAGEGEGGEPTRKRTRRGSRGGRGRKKKAASPDASATGEAVAAKEAAVVEPEPSS